MRVQCGTKTRIDGIPLCHQDTWSCVDQEAFLTGGSSIQSNLPHLSSDNRPTSHYAHSAGIKRDWIPEVSCTEANKTEQKGSLIAVRGMAGAKLGPQPLVERGAEQGSPCTAIMELTSTGMW